MVSKLDAYFREFLLVKNGIESSVTRMVKLKKKVHFVFDSCSAVPSIW